LITGSSVLTTSFFAFLILTASVEVFEFYLCSDSILTFGSDSFAFAFGSVDFDTRSYLFDLALLNLLIIEAFF